MASFYDLCDTPACVMFQLLTTGALLWNIIQVWQFEMGLTGVQFVL